MTPSTQCRINNYEIIKEYIKIIHNYKSIYNQKVFEAIPNYKNKNKEAKFLQ